jgi:3-hydroxyacyl-CoA dehydrogenase
MEGEFRPFSLKTLLPGKDEASTPSRAPRTISSHAILIIQRNPLALQHDVAVSLLTHKGGFLYLAAHLKQVLFSSIISSGLEVMLYDKYTHAIKGATDDIEGWLKETIKLDCLAENKAREARLRIKTVFSLGNALMDSDLVNESVPENDVLKRQVLTEIDPLLPQNASLCTNSSSLPCSRMADVLRRPERFFNINFSQPHEPADKLVELMRGEKPSDETLILGEEFVRMLNMVPIITYKEIMAFSFNRVWRAIKREILNFVGDGYSNFEDVDRA